MSTSKLLMLILFFIFIVAFFYFMMIPAKDAIAAPSSYSQQKWETISNSYIGENECLRLDIPQGYLVRCGKSGLVFVSDINHSWTLK